LESRIKLGIPNINGCEIFHHVDYLLFFLKRASKLLAHINLRFK
jgi:hypothetical protein